MKLGGEGKRRDLGDWRRDSKKREMESGEKKREGNSGSPREWWVWGGGKE